MAGNLLPRVLDLEAYRRMRLQRHLWEPAIRAVCRRHGIAASDLVQCPEGTHVVFFAGMAHVVKLFCELWRDDYRA